MRSFYLADLTPLPRGLRGGLWLIGNFDGVHRGHQALIAALRQEAGRVRLLTFDPHPRAFFSPKTAPRPLTSWPHKRALLAAAGVDVLVIRCFDAAFASLSAERFVSDVLVRQLGAQGVGVGPDFRFGAGRAGDVELLARHLTVRQYPAVCDEQGLACSSTRIREALAQGNVVLAERLLGRPCGQEMLGLSGNSG